MMVAAAAAVLRIDGTCALAVAGCGRRTGFTLVTVQYSKVESTVGAFFLGRGEGTRLAKRLQ